MKSIYSIIKAPLMTEKANRILANRQYIFWVAKEANKVEIKQAIEKIYKVKVQRVSSMIIKGKMKRLRFNQPGKTCDWKKSIVTLRKGFEIKLA